MLDPWTAQEELPGSIGGILQILEAYEERCREHGIEFDVMEALEVMRADPVWLVDERTRDLIRRYLFFMPNPAAAFPGSFDEQPFVWVVAKAMIDEGINSVKNRPPEERKERWRTLPENG